MTPQRFVQRPCPTCAGCVEQTAPAAFECRHCDRVFGPEVLVG